MVSCLEISDLHCRYSRINLLQTLRQLDYGEVSER